MVAFLTSLNAFVRGLACDTLAELEPATLAQYADAVVHMLDQCDEDDDVAPWRSFLTLGKLHPDALKR